MSGKAFEVRDPIHTSIPFDAFERQVIDHPFVQRLRHIKQVGLVSLVYPGGHHDRFSHSLGVMHLAGRLFDGIAAPESRFVDVFSKEQCAYLRTCVRLAGLLHDVGHPPFSHSLEELLPDLSLLDLPKPWFESALPKRQSRHEDFTLWLINALSERYHVFDARMAQDVASLVHHKVRPSESGAKFKGKGGWNAHGLLRSLISGECDADRMDYLLRDSYHCGVAYGSYDLSRIIFSMQPYFDTASHNVHLCMDANGIYSFEDFLLARYHMFLQVYLHKTVICFDHFLQQAFLEREIQFPHLKSPEEYMRLTDHDVHVWLMRAADHPRNHWSSRLVLRKPAKRLIQLSQFDYNEQEIPEISARVEKVLKGLNIFYFSKETRQYLTRLGNQGSPPFFVYRPTVDGRDRFVPMEQYSRLIEKYNERIYAVNFYVWHTDADRARAAVSAVI